MDLIWGVEIDVSYIVVIDRIFIVCVKLVVLGEDNGNVVKIVIIKIYIVCKIVVFEINIIEIKDVILKYIN